MPVYTVGVLLLVAVALFGITKKGAQRWLNVGVVIQPSEIMKIAVPLMLACWFQWRQGQGRSQAVDFAGAFALLAVPVALIMKQPDLGTALLVMASGLAVIFFAGLPWRWRAWRASCFLAMSFAPTGWTGTCCVNTSASACARCWTPCATRWARAFTSCKP